MTNSHMLWAITVLKDAGYLIHASQPEIIQKTPWSMVCCIKTNQGPVYLKKVPPALSLESRIINILSNEFHANVPSIIAVNQRQHCFLMKNAGKPLHDYFKQNFQPDILIQAMQDYTRLQISTSDKIHRFLDTGVPDWRLKNLPKLYQDLIAQEMLLINDGLNNDELMQLRVLEPALFSICEELSHYKIKETFGHADFHDKNILIDLSTKKSTIIDLGEVVITHPFFSFLNCLHRAKLNFSLSESQYQQLQHACFKPWLALDTSDHLIEILTLIQQCWPIHSVLGEFRLMNSVDKSAFQELHRQGRLSNNLRHWINHMSSS
ncbi:hypothetical protein AQUSIP_07110 [Aquicella siphonis]|uniref:Aminoglycoside phosphotransferase domain-containing protein n=1 Tax=Aquicella siphonis TaxID=254247 RepID=A0A5E4PGI3_9COXI|nr:phosphotransferase [Aquicella siphonis]VVC75421.1 hypothetical protein AQUSIP_07110 [Aquicella siphonis]